MTEENTFCSYVSQPLTYQLTKYYIFLKPKMRLQLTPDWTIYFLYFLKYNSS